MRSGLFGPLIVKWPVLLLLFVACSPFPRSEHEFRELLPANDINMSVVLDSAVVDESRQAGFLVMARITNLSEQWLVFPSEYGAVGYSWVEENGQWEEIPNAVQTPQMPFLLGPAGGPDATGGTVVFSPGKAWPDSGTLRIAVHGALRNDDESLGKEVAAYIDVRLPE